MPAPSPPPSATITTHRHHLGTPGVAHRSRPAVGKPHGRKCGETLGSRRPRVARRPADGRWLVGPVVLHRQRGVHWGAHWFRAS